MKEIDDIEFRNGTV